MSNPLNDPKVARWVHTVAVILWAVLAVLTTAWALLQPDNKYLLAWVIFMSAYANLAAHWSAREAAGAEAKPE